MTMVLVCLVKKPLQILHIVSRYLFLFWETEPAIRKRQSLLVRFGVVFYSSFIVADKVTVETRRAGCFRSEAVRWGGPWWSGEFNDREHRQETRGTRITLHLRRERFADNSVFAIWSHKLFWFIFLPCWDGEACFIEMGWRGNPKPVRSKRKRLSLKRLTLQKPLERARNEVTERRVPRVSIAISHDYRALKCPTSGR